MLAARGMSSPSRENADVSVAPLTRMEFCMANRLTTNSTPVIDPHSQAVPLPETSSAGVGSSAARAMTTQVR